VFKAVLAREKILMKRNAIVSIVKAVQVCEWTPDVFVEHIDL
jgi:hypothetical protein